VLQLVSEEGRKQLQRDRAHSQAYKGSSMRTGSSGSPVGSARNDAAAGDDESKVSEQLAKLSVSHA
jgi:hypothetical protein